MHVCVSEAKLPHWQVFWFKSGSTYFTADKAHNSPSAEHNILVQPIIPHVEYHRMLQRLSYWCRFEVQKYKSYDAYPEVLVIASNK